MYQSNSPFFQDPQPPAPPPQYATGIPVDQYVAPHHPMINGKWSSSLCACCSDVPNCCLTCWCPCITFGQVAEFLDEGNTSCKLHGAIYAIIASFTCCGCLYSFRFRTKLRELYGVQPETNNCNDCLVHFLCEPCALCQEHRELRDRGIDMSIGWQANEERRNSGVQMPPMAPAAMYR